MIFTTYSWTFVYDMVRMKVSSEIDSELMLKIKLILYYHAYDTTLFMN